MRHTPSMNAAPAGGPPLERAGAFRRFMSSHGTPVALTLPFFILFLIFVAWPVLRSLYLSFTDYDAVSAPHLIGFANYVALIQDPRFLKALSNTTIYMLFTALLTTTLGLLLAIVFGGQGVWDQLMRAAFFLPSVAGGVGIISVWKWIASSEDFGLLNTIRRLFGAQPLPFLGNPHYALPILISMAVWGGMGYSMILFVAGLRGIPNEIYEAAAIDGANPLQRFWRITLPMLRPTILFVLVTGMIGAFQEFYSFYIMFSDTNNVGGILDSGLSLVVYLFDLGFRHLEMGLASALAWVLFLVLVILTFINLRIGRINEVD